MRRLRRQRRLPALRRADVRGLQGLLQAHRPEELQVRVPGRQELPGGQAAPQPLPVLPLPQVSGGGHGEGGGAHGRPEGPPRPPAHQAQEPRRRADRPERQPLAAVGLSRADCARLHRHGTVMFTCLLFFVVVWGGFRLNKRGRLALFG